MEHSALFAKASYDMVKSGNKTKRIDGINKTIAHTGFTADSNLSNRDILYLKNNKTGEHHIAVRGTDASSRGLKKTQDIMTDLKFAMGKESHDKHFKKKINKTYTQSRVSMHLHMHIQSQFFAVCLNSGWMEAFDTSDIAGQ